MTALFLAAMAGMLAALGICALIEHVIATRAERQLEMERVLRRFAPRAWRRPHTTDGDA